MVTQNYFLQGRHSRDIRNSCNYVALFRNCGDHLLNKRVATAFGLKKAYEAAESEIYKSQVYPYVFIDQTQRAQLSSYRLYSDILSDYRIAYSELGMKAYILNEADFLSGFQILSSKPGSVIAINKNENQRKEIQESASSKNGPEKSKKSKLLRKEKRRRINEENL